MQSSETTKCDQPEEAKGPASLQPDAVVAHSMDDLRQMYEHHNSLKGIIPKDLQEEEKKEPQVKQPRTIAIPEKIFEDFKELTAENEPFFQFMAFFATVTFLEKVEDDFWALEFPACISSEGRPFLYKVAAYFKLAYHT
jgi:hypothetical protein